MPDKSVITIQIANIFGEEWILNNQSIDFLYSLFLEEPEILTYLLNTLNELCDKQRRGLALKAWHVDSIINSWQTLQTLSCDILLHLDTYLHENQATSQSNPILPVVAQLRSAHLGQLTTQAEQYHLQHHTAFHALEMKIRSMLLIMNQLGLLNTNSPQDVFLRELIFFMIEFHDYEQKNKQHFASVEAITARKIADWLIETLNLKNEAPKLIPLIEICAHWVVELGTTMIWGSTSTMDLIELFLLFNQIVCQSRTKLNRVTNQSLGTLLSIIALITGLCDKNPAASRYLMEHESHQENPYQPPLILQQFLDTQLESYFTGGDLKAINQRAWKTTWPPHFNMRLELSLSDSNLQSHAIELSQLLKTYQKNLIADLDNTLLDIWLNKECPHLQTLIEALFFNNRQSTQTNGLTGERNFSLSQLSTVHFAAETLPYLLHEWDQRSIESTQHTLMIEPNVPFVDANNLMSLEQFYNQCEPFEKKQLCRDLFAAAAQQMGVAYTLQSLPAKPTHFDVPIQTRPASCCQAFCKLLPKWSWFSTNGRVQPIEIRRIGSHHTTSLSVSAR